MGDKVPEAMRKESLDDYRMGLLKDAKGAAAAQEGKGKRGEGQGGESQG